MRESLDHRISERDEGRIGEEEEGTLKARSVRCPERLSPFEIDVAHAGGIGDGENARKSGDPECSTQSPPSDRNGSVDRSSKEVERFDDEFTPPIDERPPLDPRAIQRDRPDPPAVGSM